MSAKTRKKYFIPLALTLIVTAAFFFWLNNFNQTQKRTVDEVAYFYMGWQLTVNSEAYHSRPYGTLLESKGREAPDYFFKPLFKHPPFFAFLISLSMRLFGREFVSAFYVSLLFGVLLIPLTYFLGRLIFNERVGLLAAIIISQDPISIICSQKVWMETTLSFFTLLAVCLFVGGVKSRRDSFFIWSGIAAGLAVNTKYPGVLATAITLAYAGFWERSLFKNRKFLLSLFIPMGMLLPWLFWNWQVYGLDFLKLHLKTHDASPVLAGLPQGLAVMLLFVICIVAMVRLFGNKGKFLKEKIVPVAQILRHVLGFAFFAVIIKDVLLSFEFARQPKTSWVPGTFAAEPFTFYFRQLVKFSLLYIFSFAAFFIRPLGERKEERILYISPAIILLFYIVWRNFQCRYILASIPFLIVLGANFILWLFDKILALRIKSVRLFVTACLIVFLSYVLYKVIFINNIISYPNNLCYF